MPALKKYRADLLLLILLPFTANLFAEEMDFYAGVGIGITHAQTTCSNLEITPIINGCDEKDTGYKIFGGYQVNKYAAVELAWLDLGEATVSGPLSPTLTWSGSSETEVISLSAKLTLPVYQKAGIFAKGGVAYWDNESNTISAGVVVRESDSGFSPIYGGGLYYWVSKSLLIRLEWERVHDVADSPDGSDSPWDMASLGVVYYF